MGTFKLLAWKGFLIDTRQTVHMKLLARGGFPCTFAAKLAGRTVSLIAGREGGHHELFANVCTQLIVRVRGGFGCRGA